MILFSIIIPTYNRVDFIKKAIDSVIAQRYTAWELIIIDDASTDDTPKLLASYSDPRISSYRNTQNMERSNSRNRGIELAKGDYICFLDSDDYYLPDHLLLLAQCIESHGNAKALFHSGVKQVNLTKNTERIIERSISINAVDAVLDVHIPVISVAIHKEIVADLKFDARLKINEDVHLFARIAALYPVIYCSTVTVVWVLHGSNTMDQERDYLTPQLVASEIIFKESSVSLKVSEAYKRQKYYSLYSDLVYFHAVNKRHGLSGLYFIRALYTFPFHKNNTTNLLNVLYHLPGGKGLKKIIQSFNR